VANEADVANKANEADLDKANNLRVNETDEAIGINKIVVVNKIVVADKANVISKIVAANKSIVIDEVIAAVDELDELVVAVEYDEAIDPTEADFANKASMLPCHDIIVICINMLSPFSLRKYSSSLSKMKNYFGKMTINLEGLALTVIGALHAPSG
jgi:hypothetical protein